MRIHEFGKMAVAVQRAFIAGCVSEKREEGIDILCLVIGPDGGEVLVVSAGAVHEAAARGKDALCGPELGKREQVIQYGVRCFQNQ